MEKRCSKVDDSGGLTEKEMIRAERNAGFISSRLREIQMQNYLRKKEQKTQQEKDLREGLQFFKNGKYEEALDRFESVLGSKPRPDDASVAKLIRVVLIGSTWSLGSGRSIEVRI
ncbi:unnamed protein product [Eruca vesicaria subsp. sativa]|uniref:Uncharacterized protein n=1 Tax=Eruca vesicaria subsp. sativa TaxID=29727 RepID=A0ABC8JR70_ERUVS|nr:unnamed protein product [Eruca vesicaria subsp. sativa]